MYRSRVFLIVVLLLAFSAVPALAQNATGTPSQTNQQVNQQMMRIRIAYLDMNGPTLVPYVDNNPSGIANLQPQNVSSWVDLPVGSTISLIPQGSAKSQALVGPLSVGSTSQSWTTIAILNGNNATAANGNTANNANATPNGNTANATPNSSTATNGSTANTTSNVEAFVFNENFGPIPAGCARVTVLQGIAGGPAVNISLSNGTVIGSNLSFPGMNGQTASSQTAQSTPSTTTGSTAQTTTGSQTGTQASTDASAPCAASTTANSSTSQSGSTAQSTPSTTTGQNTQSANGVGGQSTGVVAPLGALDCMAVQTTTTEGTSSQSSTTAQSTPSSTTGQTTSAASVGLGQRINNCGFTVDVPVGTFNLQVMPTGSTTSAIAHAANTTFNANTYYLVALTGDMANPQFVISSTSSGAVASQNNAQSSSQGSAQATAMPTTTSP